jgi:DNA repair exonuclease SbcCD ATPase subunit
MKLASDALKIVTQGNAGVAKNSSLRAWEQNDGAESDTDNLMGLLGEIDGLKQEIHERMRRVEAVKQAKSVILEDAVRTEALNKRLAQIGKVMSAVHPGLAAGEKNSNDPVGFRIQVRELLAESEPGDAPATTASEGVTLPWRRPEDSLDASLNAPSGQTVDSAALSLTDLSLDIGSGSISEASRVVFNVASKRLEEAEHEWREAWTRSDEAAQEAKRLFEESTLRLNLASAAEERAKSEFRSAQESLTSVYQSANERLVTAEQRWEQTDQVILEAKRYLEQSTSRLDLASQREESAAARLEAGRNEFAAGYQSSSQRLEEAERFFQKGNLAAKEAQHLIDQSTAELLQARSAEEKAAADLLSARQELTTAYQFASVAAQRRLESAETFRKAARWAVFATGFSWVVMVWAVWLALRTAVPPWGPAVATAVVILLVIVLDRLRAREV